VIAAAVEFVREPRTIRVQVPALPTARRSA